MLLIEKLAEIEHEQWIVWSKSISKSENLAEERLKRWEKLWIPYSELNEEMKEEDRKWARKVLAVLADEKRMGKIEKIKLWFIDVTNYQVSTNDAQKLLDMLGIEKEK